MKSAGLVPLMNMFNFPVLFKLTTQLTVYRLLTVSLSVEFIELTPIPCRDA